jgi:hypothetical protein
MNKVFLGGTCNETTWRDDLIKVLQVDYFNPVVEDWTPECIDLENDQKSRVCNIHLYVITADMSGVYSIAEVVQSSLTAGKTTILHVIPDGFNQGQLKSLVAVCGLVSSNGAIAYIDEDLRRTARVINGAFAGPYHL